jgi:acyl transferase domain-containing protein
MALAAAERLFPTGSEVRDIRFEELLLLDARTEVAAVASIDAPGVAAFAVQTDDAGERVRRAAAALHAVEDGLQPARRDLTGLLAAHPGTVSGEEIRLSLAARGIEFGPAFTGLTRVHTAADGSTLLAEIGAPAGIRAQQSGYGIHPAVLDACFQSVGAHLLVGGRRDGGLLLPLSVGRLRRFGAGRDARYCQVTVTKADSTAIEADLEVLDENGEVVLEVSRLRMGSGASKSSDREHLLADRLLTVAWEQRQPPTAPAVAGVWLLISSGDADDDLPTDLADALVAGGAQCRTAHLGADTEVLARDLAADGLTGVVIVTAPAGGDPNEVSTICG